MGQKQSAEKNKQLTEAIATIAHPLFDKVKFLSNKDGQYLQIAVPVVNEGEVKDWHNAYKPFQAHECLLLPLSHEFKGTQMCGSSGLCEIKFDNYPFLLQGEISDRNANEKKYFENGELLYLALTILEAANIFHSQDTKIGDVRPLNVFINQNGQAKIATHLTWPHQTTNYEKTVFDKEVTYLAPEQIKYEYFGHTSPKVNVQISQSFSVGLTLLDSALLTKSYDLYNIKNNRFDYELLQRRINELFSLPFYDQNVKKIIAGLCRLNHMQRLKCRQVFAWLNKYRQKIINIQPFRFQQIPYFLSGNIKPATTQSILRPALQPQPQPIYFESQVIANHPQAVLSPVPVRFTGYVQNNVQYPFQRVENRGDVSFQQPKPIVHVDQRPIPRQQNAQNIPQQNRQDFKLTLSKIQQQLEMSRRMFPS